MFVVCWQEKSGADGLRLTKLEVARVLRERNEYKEKYLSLLEQVRSVYTYILCMYVSQGKFVMVKPFTEYDG